MNNEDVVDKPVELQAFRQKIVELMLSGIKQLTARQLIEIMVEIIKEKEHE
jgi:hypothetical protein